MSRLFNTLFRTVIAVSLATLPAMYAGAQVDMLSYEMRSLRTADEVVDFAAYRGKVSVVMLFQPHCEYCVRQTRVFNSLSEACPGLQPFAIGVNGSRANLQREMRQMRADFPVVQTNADFEADIGEVIGTPLVFINDRDGMLVTWLRGYQSGDTLRDLIDRIDASVCTAD